MYGLRRAVMLAATCVCISAQEGCCRMEAVKVNISAAAHCRKRKNRKGRKSGMTFLAALFQMLALLIMVGAGFYMAKRGMLDEHTNTHMSAMLVNVFNPMLIISSAVSAAGQVSKASLLLVGGIAVGMFALFIVVGMVIMPFFDRNPEQRKMFQSMFVFSNVGFIGIPVVSSILGPEYVVYVTEFMLVYSVIFYTYGVALLEGKFSSESLKSMVNPGTVCSIAAFFIVAFDIGLPGFLKTAVTYLGNVTSPHGAGGRRIFPGPFRSERNIQPAQAVSVLGGEASDPSPYSAAGAQAGRRRHGSVAPLRDHVRDAGRQPANDLRCRERHRLYGLRRPDHYDYGAVRVHYTASFGGALRPAVKEPAGKFTAAVLQDFHCK